QRATILSVHVLAGNVRSSYEHAIVTTENGMFKTAHSLARLFVVLALALLSEKLAAQAMPPVKAFDVQADQPGRIVFTGSKTADLFTREVDESFKGVLEHSYVSQTDGKFPAGFVNASPPSQPWAGTMWTRDAVTFLRELVNWGYYQHACQTAQGLMDFVG